MKKSIFGPFLGIKMNNVIWSDPPTIERFSPSLFTEVAYEPLPHYFSMEFEESLIDSDERELQTLKDGVDSLLVRAAVMGDEKVVFFPTHSILMGGIRVLVDKDKAQLHWQLLDSNSRRALKLYSVGDARYVMWQTNVDGNGYINR